jgi:hypothetical protein
MLDIRLRGLRKCAKQSQNGFPEWNTHTGTAGVKSDAVVFLSASRGGTLHIYACGKAAKEIGFSR